MSRVPYPVFCAALGLAFGVVPAFFHGPIPEKWSYYYYGQTPINGETLVWGYYIARLSIGALVGITVWPSAWFLRGPLCGVVMMVPLGFVALANPLCAGL